MKASRLILTGLAIGTGLVMSGCVTTPEPRAVNTANADEACRADFVDKNPDLAKAYVRDITLGMKKALANREETLKVVSEVLKAPIPVLDTYLLKDNDFGRDPGAAPNFPAIQKMLDIYAETGMLPKMDVAQFKHPTIVAPLQ